MYLYLLSVSYMYVYLIVESSQIIEDCKDALYAAKVCSYAQGMSLIQAASDQVI